MGDPIVARSETGIHHVIVATLLNLLLSIEGQPRTYRHRDSFSRQIFLPPPYGSAGPASLNPPAVPVQSMYTNLQLATGTQHIRNNDELSEGPELLLSILARKVT